VSYLTRWHLPPSALAVQVSQYHCHSSTGQNVPSVYERKNYKNVPNYTYFAFTVLEFKPGDVAEVVAKGLVPNRLLPSGAQALLPPPFCLSLPAKPSKLCSNSFTAQRYVSSQRSGVFLKL